MKKIITTIEQKGSSFLFTTSLDGDVVAAIRARDIHTYDESFVLDSIGVALREAMFNAENKYGGQLHEPNEKE